MKKIVMLCASLLLVATVTFGQQRQKVDPQVRVQKQSDRMKWELSLDENQYASVKSINEKYLTRGMAIRKDETLATPAKVAEMKKLRVEKNQEIEKVLTPEQKTRWQEIKTERRERAKERKAGRKDFRNELNLSPDQKAKLHAENKQFRERMAVLREKHRQNQDARAERLKLRQEHESNVKGILTEEQYSKYKAFREKKRSQRHEKRRHK